MDEPIAMPARGRWRQFATIATTSLRLWLPVDGSAAARHTQPLYDPAVRESIDRIEGPEAGAKIVVSSYRPKGKGSFQKIKVRVLWFYSGNDEHIGGDAQQAWFCAFHDAGRKGELNTIPGFRERHGPGVFPAPHGVRLLTPAVRRTLRAPAPLASVLG